MLPLIKEALVRVGAAAVRAVTRAIVGKLDEPDPEPAHVGKLDLAHIREQEQRSIAASKAAERVRRNAVTTRPPARVKSDTLPSREDFIHAERSTSSSTSSAEGSTDAPGQRPAGDGDDPSDRGDPPDSGG